MRSVKINWLKTKLAFYGVWRITRWRSFPAPLVDDNTTLSELMLIVDVLLQHNRMYLIDRDAACAVWLYFIIRFFRRKSTKLWQYPSIICLSSFCALLPELEQKEVYSFTLHMVGNNSSKFDYCRLWNRLIADTSRMVIAFATSKLIGQARKKNEYTWIAEEGPIVSCISRLASQCSHRISLTNHRHHWLASQS